MKYKIYAKEVNRKTDAELCKEINKYEIHILSNTVPIYSNPFNHRYDRMSPLNIHLRYCSNNSRDEIVWVKIEEFDLNDSNIFNNVNLYKIKEKSYKIISSEFDLELGCINVKLDYEYKINYIESSEAVELELEASNLREIFNLTLRRVNDEAEEVYNYNMNKKWYQRKKKFDAPNEI